MAGKIKQVVTGIKNNNDNNNKFHFFFLKGENASYNKAKSCSLKSVLILCVRVFWLECDMNF